MKRLRCLFVDWHNTLSTSMFWGHLGEPEHPYHYMLGPISEVIFRDVGRYDTVLVPWMRGELTSEEVVGVICGETGFDERVVLEELMVSCQRMRFVSREVPRYVGEVRARGVKVMVATDNMDTFGRWTVPSLGLDRLFDDVLCSADVKGLKADVGADGRSVFFARFLEKYQIEVGESLLLDDGEEEFGDVIRGFGIGYQRIVPGVGLVPALERLLGSM